MADKKVVGVIVVIAILAVIVIARGGLFGTFAILPSGQYVANSDCTFQSNVDTGANGEQYTDYGNSGIWISVDWNKDGTKEGYGFYGSTSTTGDVCSGKTLLATTPGGLRVVQYSSGTGHNEVGVCSPSGSNVQRFRNTANAASNAILTCGQVACTPNWQCTSFSTCTNSVQTRICTDANSCVVTTGKPAESQSCTSGSGTLCPSFNDLINYAQQWQSCSA